MANKTNEIGAEGLSQAEALKIAEKAQKLAVETSKVCAAADQSNSEVQVAVYNSLICEGGKSNYDKADKLYASMSKDTRLKVESGHNFYELVKSAIKTRPVTEDSFVCLIPKL